MNIPRGALVAFIAIASIVHAGNFAPQDPDLGLHLSVGKIISEEGQQPLQDRFTYTTADEDFINFEWAFDWASYGLYQMGGGTALWLIKLFFIALIGGLLFSLARMYARGDPSLHSKSALWLLALVLLSIPAYRYRLVVRPHLVGYFMLLLHLLLVRLFVENKDRKQEFVLGSILIGTMPIWAFTHGSWPLALAISGLHFLLSPQRSKALCILIALEVIVLLPNPHGLALLWVPFEHLLAAGGGPIPEEWMAANRILPSGHLFIFYSCALLFALTTALTRNFRFLPELVLGLLLIFMAHKMARFVAPALLVTLPLTAIFLTELTASLEPRKRKAVVALAMGLGLTSYISFFEHPGQDFPSGTSWHTETMPRSAAATIKKHHYEGRIFNDFDIGNDLCWTLGAANPHAIDGRVNLFGADGLKEYMEALTNPKAFQTHVADHDVQMVLIQWSIPRNQRLAQHLISSQEFGLVHMDARYALWLRDKALENARSKGLVFQHLRLPIPPYDLTTMVVSLQKPGELLKELKRIEGSQAEPLSSLMKLSAHSALAQNSTSQTEGESHAKIAIETATLILETHNGAQLEALYAHLRRAQARLLIDEPSGARTDFEMVLKHMNHPEAEAGLRKIPAQN